MGRAIVRNPKVFLMDEPLSNLDAKLRVQMRVEISELIHIEVQVNFRTQKLVNLDGGLKYAGSRSCFYKSEKIGYYVKKAHRAALLAQNAL